MTPVLVDANILIDISTADPVWSEWSAEALMRLGRETRLVINPLIYAEVSVTHSRVETLDAALPEEVFAREPLPWAAGFLAGKVFVTYRRRGGTRRSPMPDFYIGAHAAVRGYRLLTRDRARYAGYFPRVELISPEAA